MDRRAFNKLTGLAAIGALSGNLELRAEQTTRAGNVEEHSEKQSVFSDEAGLYDKSFLTTTSAAINPEKLRTSIHLKDDQPVLLRFFGSPSADLFTRELDESFQGVLRESFVGIAGNGFPAGFVNASLQGRPWAGTMWTRDAGTFLRELVMRGYYEHAALLSECLMNLVEKNQDGFYSFPRYFKGTKPGSGTEFDGTAAIIIGMVLLWERLPGGNPTKDRIYHFLYRDSSPVNYFMSYLKTRPLVAGTGEFGCGMGIHGECCNVVQNALTMLALLAAANMAEESNATNLAKKYRNVAAKISNNMEKYLVDKEGCWIWCVDPRTLKPNSAVLNAKVNRGFGGIDGVASMYADVLGFQPLESSWKGVEHCEKTFQQLYNIPLRKREFDRYGIWTQFDSLAAGLLTSPSYGQGYALQTMLLYDKLAMADKALSWLANATYNPIPEYKLQRESRWYFYERMYSPDAVGKIVLAQGCGPLNLVNVTEPLKVSRLLLGVDDSALQHISLIPRIPPSWKGVEANHWPIRTRRGIVRANILFKRTGVGAELTLELAPGQQIDNLKVRMPSTNGDVWYERKHTSTVRFVTQ